MKVVDSFIFFNELDLLEIRLNILDNFVDYFVITESPFTVSGNEKPLFYYENRDRYSKFNHKIIHNITETIPNDFTDYMEKTKYHVAYGQKDNNGTRFIDLPIRFQRALYNRNASAYGIEKSGVCDDDLIITSDADEIINPYVLSDLSWFDPDNHYVALCRSFYYNLNYLFQENWMGSRLCTWKYLKETSIDELRQDHKNSYRIEDAGWHWSCFGTADNFRLKMKSYEHTECNVPEVVDNAEEKIEKGIDPLNRCMLTPVPIDDSYPEYILNNLEKYSQYIKQWN